MAVCGLLYGVEINKIADERTKFDIAVRYDSRTGEKIEYKETVPMVTFKEKCKFWDVGESMSMFSLVKLLNQIYCNHHSFVYEQEYGAFFGFTIDKSLYFDRVGSIKYKLNYQQEINNFNNLFQFENDVAYIILYAME